MNIEAVCNSWRAMGGRLPARARQVLAVRAMHRQAIAAARRSDLERARHALCWLQRRIGADPYNSMRGAVQRPSSIPQCKE